MNSIRISNTAHFNSEIQCISFKLHLQETEIKCRISMEAASDYLGIDRNLLSAGWLGNQTNLARICQWMVERNRFQEDGSILIKSSDLIEMKT